MSVFRKPIWDKIEENEKETITKCAIIDAVEEVLQNMWTSVALSESIFESQKPQLSSELFITTYYLRNISFLLGSYQLAKQGLVIPSHNLQRTILETIVKGYMFIVEDDISDMNFIATHRDGTTNPENVGVMQNIIKKSSLNPLFLDSAKKIVNKEDIDEQDQKELVKQIKDHSFFNKNIDLIYSKSRETQWRRLYGRINPTAHASVQGVLGDILYNVRGVRESLEIILLLSYANITMYLERFYPKFNNSALSTILKDSLNLIIAKLGQSIDIEPNKVKYSTIIKFKTDSFRRIL